MPFAHFLGDDSSETELDEDEIENMLDEGLPDDLRNKKKENQYEEKFKTVLEGLFVYCCSLFFFVLH